MSKHSAVSKSAKAGSGGSESYREFENESGAGVSVSDPVIGRMDGSGPTPTPNDAHNTPASASASASGGAVGGAAGGIGTVTSPQSGSTFTVRGAALASLGGLLPAEADARLDTSTTCVAVFSGILGVGGIGTIIQNPYLWQTILLGVLCIAVAATGFLAVYLKQTKFAKYYTYGLVVFIFFVIVLSTASLGSARYDCDEADDSRECRGWRAAPVSAVIVLGVVFPIVCCGVGSYCAHQLTKELAERDELLISNPNMALPASMLVRVTTQPNSPNRTAGAAPAGEDAV